MPVKSYKLGPGTLILGETGAPIDVSAQVSKLIVAWSVESDDDVDVLSGDVLAGEDDWSAKLSGTMVQDLAEGGNVRWSWEHKGEVVPFEFVPSSAAGLSCTGSLKVAPLDLGGDAKTKPTSDFEWNCVGEPSLADAV